MFKTILVGSDGSESALQAAGMAAQLALKFGSELILLNVFDPSTMMPSTLGVWDAGIASEAFVQYASDIQRAAERNTGKIFEQAGVPYLPLREMGHPVEILVSVAERKQADLIVLGSRGLSAWQALLLGSVSEGVLHHAICPVLIARGHPKPLHRILLACDTSEGAQRAARVAFAMAKPLDAWVTVLNVYEPTGLFAVAAGVNPNPVKAVEEQLAAERMHEAVDASLKPLSEQAGVKYALRQERGHPAETIVRVAAASGFDLIILGSRGLGTFKSLLLGSVADRVVHYAGCSVLIVR